MKLLYYLVIGALFGLGLIVAGIVNPAKVLNFLDIFGTWDPSLAFVMAGGLAVNLIGQQLIAKRLEQPLVDGEFPTPTETKIDRSLIIGSALFGIGWGTAGFCPGPAIVALGSLNLFPIVFVVCVILGMGFVRLARQRKILG